MNMSDLLQRYKPKPGHSPGFFILPLAKKTMTTELIHTNIQREIIRLFAQADAWFDRDLTWLISKQQDGVSVAARLACLQRSSNHYLDKKSEASAWATEQILAEQITDLFECLNDPLDLQDLSREELKNMRSELRDVLERCLFTLDLLEAGSHGVESFERAGVYMNMATLLLQGHEQLRAIKEAEQTSTNMVVY